MGVGGSEGYTAIMTVVLIFYIHEISIYFISTYFRSRTYQFDDFLAQWTEKLRGGEQEATIMTVRLTKDVDKYKVRQVSKCSLNFEKNLFRLACFSHACYAHG